MKRFALALVLCGYGVAAAAQEPAGEAPGGTLRVLDKLAGTVRDLNLKVGEKTSEGRLSLQLDDCRFPLDNPMADAFAHVTVIDTLAATPVFEGWMLASSPALSAMDHPRYDVWVLRCDVPPEALAAAAATNPAPDALMTESASPDQQDQPAEAPPVVDPAATDSTGG